MAFMSLLCVVLSLLSVKAATIQHLRQEGEASADEVSAVLDAPAEAGLAAAAPTASETQLELTIDKIKTENLPNLQSHVLPAPNLGPISNPVIGGPVIGGSSSYSGEIKYTGPSFDIGDKSGEITKSLYCDDVAKRCPEGLWCHNHQCDLLSPSSVQLPSLGSIPAGYAGALDAQYVPMAQYGEDYITNMHDKVKDLPDHADRLTDPDWALLAELQKYRKSSGYVAPPTSGVAPGTTGASVDINFDKFKTGLLDDPKSKLKPSSIDTSSALSYIPAVNFGSPPLSSPSGLDAKTELVIDKITVANMADHGAAIKKDEIGK